MHENNSATHQPSVEEENGKSKDGNDLRDEMSTLGTKLENLKEQVSRISQIQGVQELEQDGVRASVQLEICIKLSRMVQNVFTTLVRHTGDLRREVGSSGKTSLALEAVKDLTTTLHEQHQFLGSQLVRLERDKKLLNEPGEQQKFSGLKREHRGQSTQIEQLERMFASLFSQQWKQVRLHLILSYVAYLRYYVQ